MTTSSRSTTPARVEAGEAATRRVSAVWLIWRAHRTVLMTAAGVVGAAAASLLVLRLLVGRKVDSAARASGARTAATAPAHPSQWE